MSDLSPVAREIVQALAHMESGGEKLSHTKIVELYRNYSREQLSKRPRDHRRIQGEFGKLFKKSYAWSNNYAVLLGLAPSLLKRIDMDAPDHIPLAVVIQLAKMPMERQEEFLQQGIEQTGGAPKKLESWLTKINRDRRVIFFTENRKRLAPGAKARIAEIEKRIGVVQDHLCQTFLEMKKLMEDLGDLKLLYVLPESTKPEQQESVPTNPSPTSPVAKLVIVPTVTPTPTSTMKQKVLPIPVASALLPVAPLTAVPVPVPTPRAPQSVAISNPSSKPIAKEKETIVPSALPLIETRPASTQAPSSAWDFTSTREPEIAGKTTSNGKWESRMHKGKRY